MRGFIVASLAVCTLVASSCGGGRQPVELDPNTVPVASRWNGSLATPSGMHGVADIRGSAWMGADEGDGNRTRARVEIANAVPGAVHPWHIHRGQCGSDQGILGPADAYKPLKVGDEGRASSEAQLGIALPKTGDYFVNVHASSKNMGTIVGCGNLAPPSR
jgi:hypothetical protein